jgi:starch synthase (maltosyl-transferring)
MRPNLFANTPDILHEYLQYGGRTAFMTRLVLTATLGASYGIYGPPFELTDGTAVLHGSEEYLDSEKYQVRHWDLNSPGNLRDFITKINEIRRENPALHDNRRLRFIPTDNDQIIAYAKTTKSLDNIIVVAVNLDPYHTQSAWVRLPSHELGLDGPFQVHELIGEARYLWHGESNFVRLEPFSCPAQIFRVRRKIKTERDFDYYM